MDLITSSPADKSLTPGLREALINTISEGLPMVKQPYAEIARQLNCSESAVIDGIKSLIADGDLKRFGIVVRHRKLGYRANGMVVWDLPDNRVTEIGHCIGQYSFVTLCYQRPRRLPEWRYNLFSMIHGQSRAAVVDQVEFIVEQCGLQSIRHEILFSKRCFKQRGASYRDDLPSVQAGRVVNE
jgi:DNA-binding Lrp family transcriptional regulator